VTVHEDEVAGAVGAFLAKMTRKEAADMRTVFDIRGGGKPVAFFNRVIQASFGLGMDRGSSHSKTPKYKVFTIGHPWLAGFESRYKPEYSFARRPPV
jgi:hypothetical protein